MMIRKSVLICFLGMVSYVSMLAQTDTLPQIDTLPPPRAGKLDQLKKRKAVAVDSTKLLTYTLDNVNEKDSFQMKGLDKYFHQYDPARSRPFDYATLGNMGSAAMPMALDLGIGIGFALGYDQYSLYHKTADDITHLDQVRPFSELFSSGGETQSDLRMRALFSRSFENDVNWVIDYDRISQQGIYSNQAVKQTSLLTSVKWNSTKRVTTFLSYIINSSVENANGGVRDLETLGEAGNTIRANVSVLSTDASMRQQNQNIVFNAFYALGRDSVSSDFKTSIQYQAQLYNEFFRFTDQNIASDSIFYKNFKVGERGLRNYNEHFRLRNAAFINSSFKDYYNFKAGVVYDYNTLDLSGTTDVLNEIYLTFNGGIRLRKRLSLDVDFYYGLLDVANEFGLDANAQLSLTKNQGFNFGFIATRYGVNLAQETVFLNQELFYDFDIAPIFLQTLKAEYYNHKLSLTLGGKLQNTFNFQYYDRESLPAQDGGLYSVSLLYGTWDLKVWKLLLENSAFLQNQNKEHLNLPSFFTKNSVSYYGKVFKGKMLLKAGLDLRYIVSERLPYYNPVIGQFYLNPDVEYKAYPMVDGRISFKVSSFTTFLKYENLTSFLIDDVEQTVQNYPQFDPRFRFGILWNLWN